MVKSEEDQQKRDLGELTVEELERQEGLELPHREALSPLTPHLPIDPQLLPEVQPGDIGHGGEAAPETPHEPSGGA